LKVHESWKSSDIQKLKAITVGWSPWKLLHRMVTPSNKVVKQ